jgi:hypothetical protein
LIDSVAPDVKATRAAGTPHSRPSRARVSSTILPTSAQRALSPRSALTPSSRYQCAIASRTPGAFGKLVAAWSR